LTKKLSEECPKNPLKGRPEINLPLRVLQKHPNIQNSHTPNMSESPGLDLPAGNMPNNQETGRPSPHTPRLESAFHEIIEYKHE
jgi:hypothetical protein